MSCSCSSRPHENWCAEAPQGLSLGDVVERAQGSGLHPTKSAMVDFGGNYLPVSSVRGEFYRGEFVLVIGVMDR